MASLEPKNGIVVPAKAGPIIAGEEFASTQDAVTREKQLKNWHRDWKIRLIEEDNPDWSDLSRLLQRAAAMGPGLRRDDEKSEIHVVHIEEFATKLPLNRPDLCIKIMHTLHNRGSDGFRSGNKPRIIW